MNRFCSLAIVDNTDPDNLACVLALANAKAKHQLLGVIVTGRAANFGTLDCPVPPNRVPLEAISQSNSEYILLLNTIRMKNFLNVAGHQDVPVFMGSIAPHTLVPHHIHVREEDFKDCTPEQYKMLSDSSGSLAEYGIDGNLNTAAGYLMGVGEMFDIVLGGPMTDVEGLKHNYPQVCAKIRSLHAQFGMFGFGEKGLMELGGKPRGRRQFNVACDPQAAHEILMNLRCPIYLYSSDITRVDAIGFETPEDLQAHLEKPVYLEVGSTPAKRELVRLYKIAYEKMVKPRNEKIYIHDLAPAFGYLDQFPFAQDEIEDRGVIAGPRVCAVEVIKIVDVPYAENEKERWGEIDIAPIARGDTFPDRYIATKVNSEKYLELLRRLVK